MAVRVTASSTSKGNPALYLAALTSGKNRPITDAILRKFKKKKIEAVATAHYRNALGVIGNALANQLLMSGTGGGTRLIRFHDGAGRGHTLKTKSWAPLSKRHISRAPRSKRMWRKTGKLSKMYNKEVLHHNAKGYIAYSKSDSVVRRGRYRVRHTLRFTKLPNVANKLIAEAFVFGNDGPSKGFKAHGLNRESSDLMGYPEAARRIFRYRSASSKTSSESHLLRVGKPANRPFIAQLSGRLGREMHRAVRKL